MPIRNGLLSTLRARGRTALFALLILVLTVALSLGLGMWAYCSALLARMEEQYTSVALVEYMGEDYPDADAAEGRVLHLGVLPAKEVTVYMKKLCQPFRQSAETRTGPASVPMGGDYLDLGRLAPYLERACIRP